MSIPKLQYWGNTRESMLTALPMRALRVVSAMVQYTALCHLEREPPEA